MRVLHQLVGLPLSALQRSDRNVRPMSDVQATELLATEVRENELQRIELQPSELKTKIDESTHTLPLRLLEVFQVCAEYFDETLKTERLMSGRQESAPQQSVPMTTA